MNRKCLPILIPLVLLLLGLAAWTALRPSAGQSPRIEKETLATRFRRDRDAGSLFRLLGFLPLGTPRREVERLLGRPDYSPIADQFYYATDRRSPAGTPIGLVVEYRYTDPRRGETVSTNRLESVWLGPIAE